MHLIAPRLSRRPMDSDWKRRMSPPLALLTVAALTPPEHRVTFHDENIGRPRRVGRPDLVGISVKADTFARACTLAAAWRRRGVPVVLGGIHPTVCPDDCAPWADALVIGEAEPVWSTLLADLRRGRLQPRYQVAAPADLAKLARALAYPSRQPLPAEQGAGLLKLAPSLGDLHSYHKNIS